MYFRRSAISAQQQEYIKAEGPTLNMLCKTIVIPESFRLPLDADSSGSELSIHNAPNTNIRLTFYIILCLAFHNDDKEQAESILLGLKDAAYSVEIPVEFLAEVLHYSHLTVLSRSNLLKKVLAEFLHIFTFTSKIDNIWSMLHSYPVADLAFIIVLRSLLFNRKQDIGLLDFNRPIQTDILFESMGQMIGLKSKQSREREWIVEGKWVFLEEELVTSVRLLSHSTEVGKKSVAVLSSDSSHQNSVQSEEYSPTKRKIVIEDARNAISEESHPTESDAESEVVYKHEFRRTTEEEEFEASQVEAKFQKPSTIPFQKQDNRPAEQEPSSSRQQESRFQTSVVSSVYEVVSPVPLNYDIHAGCFSSSASRSNNLFESKKFVRPDEQSNDSKGRKVSLSKERLSAKKKPEIRSIRDLGQKETRFLPGEISTDSNYYNGKGPQQQSQPTQVQFLYNSPGLPPKSNSLQKRGLRMPTTQEEEEKLMKAARRQQSPFDRSRLFVQTRPHNNP